MREAGTAGGLVLAADVIPDVDRNDRCLAIGMHHHPQAVGQGELLERDIDLAGRSRLGRQRVGRRKRAESSTESNSEQRGARAQGERHIRVLGHVGESRS
ncbi:hypothetical protein D3C71_1231540 [compost metagenome]